jgi:hypothetical protein
LTTMSKSKGKKKPEAGIIWTTDDAIPELVLRAISSDYDYDGDSDLARFYNKLSVREKAVCDVLLIRLCGWSLQTLLLCVEQKLPPDKVDGRAYDRHNPFTLLDGPISDGDQR